MISGSAIARHLDGQTTHVYICTSDCRSRPSFEIEALSPNAYLKMTMHEGKTCHFIPSLTAFSTSPG